MLVGSAASLAADKIFFAPISDFSRPKTYRTGKKYPFSSKRQNDRFARQLAEGKVKFSR